MVIVECIVCGSQQNHFVFYLVPTDVKFGKQLIDGKLAESRSFKHQFLVVIIVVQIINQYSSVFLFYWREHISIGLGFQHLQQCGSEVGKFSLLGEPERAVALELVNHLYQNISTITYVNPYPEDIDNLLLFAILLQEKKKYHLHLEDFTLYLFSLMITYKTNILNHPDERHLHRLLQKAR